MHRFANPARFLSMARRAQPICAGLSLAAIVTGVYFALLASPSDYLQGDMVRVMYVHVPAAWMAMAIYSAMALCSAGYLVWRHPLADIAAQSSAGIGAVFTFITLVTGAIWGKPTWGAWWVWDARLTSMLILFFLYLGYIALAQAGEGDERGSRLNAILALVGFINIPIIKFSVEWWNTLHQPASLMRSGGSAIDSSMLWPLLTMAIGFLFLYLYLLLLRMRTMLALRKIRRLQSQLLSIR